MINTLSILISLLGCLFVVVRAVALDKTLPWFAPPPGEAADRRGAFKPGPLAATQPVIQPNVPPGVRPGVAKAYRR